MDADIKKLKKLTAFMRKNGLLSLKTGDIELSLSPLAIDMGSERGALEEQPPNPPNQEPLTDMDVLLWSAPGNIEDMQ
jgi:hypothetical protein